MSTRETTSAKENEQGARNMTSAADQPSPAEVATESAETSYIPTTTVDLDADNAKKMLKLRDILEENDDVQEVYANDNIPEAATA